MDNNSHNNPLWIEAVLAKTDELNTPPITRRTSGVPPIECGPPVYEGIHHLNTVLPIAAPHALAKVSRKIADNRERFERRRAGVPNTRGEHRVDSESMWTPSHVYGSPSAATAPWVRPGSAQATHQATTGGKGGESLRWRGTASHPPTRVQASTGSIVISVMAALFVIGLVMR